MCDLFDVYTSAAFERHRRYLHSEGTRPTSFIMEHLPGYCGFTCKHTRHVLWASWCEGPSQFRKQCDNLIATYPEDMEDGIALDVQQFHCYVKRSRGLNSTHSHAESVHGGIHSSGPVHTTSLSMMDQDCQPKYRGKKIGTNETKSE